LSPFVIAIVAWFHIFFAVLWIGSAVLFFAVLGPAVSALSPQTRAEFMARFLPRMERFLNFVVPLLLVSGAALFVAMTWGDAPVLDTWSLSVALGGSLGLATYVFALMTLVPAGRRLSALIQGGGAQDELASAQRSLGRSSMIELVLMLLTLTAMVSAGFL
jgi:uncharacterized membrane protein